jgi:4-hydroxybenzoate polyprenyltransferase
VRVPLLRALFSWDTLCVAFWFAPLIVAYPLMKRWTHWPQLFLGITFNGGALLGWVSQGRDIDITILCLYGAAVFWTLGYDTIYAHQDTADDKHLNIGSTALLWGNKTHLMLCLSYGISLSFFILFGFLMKFTIPYFLTMVFLFCHFLWQVVTLRLHDVSRCLLIFKSNGWAGGLVMIGILLEILFK